MTKPNDEQLPVDEMIECLGKVSSLFDDLDGYSWNDSSDFQHSTYGELQDEINNLLDKIDELKKQVRPLGHGEMDEALKRAIKRVNRLGIVGAIVGKTDIEAMDLIIASLHAPKTGLSKDELKKLWVEHSSECDHANVYSFIDLICKEFHAQPSSQPLGNPNKGYGEMINCHVNEEGNIVKDAPTTKEKL